MTEDDLKHIHTIQKFTNVSEKIANWWINCGMDYRYYF